nr:type VI secretion system baseplate subunit TssG [uncultured Bartonella sp.]
MGNPESRSFTNVYWPRLLCFAGLLSTRNRSPALFSSVIARAFNLDVVNIEEWTKRKVKISDSQRIRLGKKTRYLVTIPFFGKMRLIYREKSGL